VPDGNLRLSDHIARKEGIKVFSMEWIVSHSQLPEKTFSGGAQYGDKTANHQSAVRLSWTKNTVECQFINELRIN